MRCTKQQLTLLLLGGLFLLQQPLTVAAGGTPYLLFTTYGGVHRANLDGSQNRTVHHFDFCLRGLDFDYRRNYMFWTNYCNREIWRARLDGTETTRLVTGLNCPYYLAWDWVNEKLYWTDACTGNIEVYDPATRQRKVLFAESPFFDDPWDIIVDPGTGWLYWSNRILHGTIQRATMAGTSRMTIVNNVRPDAMTLDFETQMLFWIENLRVLKSSGVDGSNPTVLTSYSTFNIYGITYFQENLYWTEVRHDAVFTAPVSSPDSITLVTNLEGFHTPWEINVVSERRQSEAQNPCTNNSVDCSYMCLLSAIAPEGYQCVCPNGEQLADNHRDCVVLSLEDEPYYVAESEGHVEVCILAIGNDGLTITGTIFTEDDAAKAGEDYHSISQNQVFVTGSRRCITLVILDDVHPEANEEFMLKLTHPIGTQESVTVNLTTVVIWDDHEGPLLPYGDGFDDLHIPPSLNNAAYMVLFQPFPFFNSSERALYVNTNGIISFRNRFTTPFPRTFPWITCSQTSPRIVPFWDYVDIRRSGSIFYRETSNLTLLQRVQEQIHGAFSSAATFVPTTLFIVTWHRVAGNRNGNEENTFQVVMATDGQRSYVLFLYYAIQWNVYFLNAGFDAGDSARSYTLPGGRTPQILSVANTSNTGVPGLYIFRVDLPEILAPGDIPVFVEQRSYVIYEDVGTIDVCVISLAEEATNVMISTKAINGNQAESETDYMPVQTMRSINPGGRRCIGIIIVNDEAIESREQFIVQLSTSQASALVLIRDEDGPLLPYGEDVGDTQVLVGQTRSSDFVDLSQPFPFFGRNERRIYVNRWGLVSFRAQAPFTSRPQQFPFESVPLIAPLWDRLQSNQFGLIFYRETADSALLERVRESIFEAFPATSTFSPTVLFIATWDQVNGFCVRVNETHTFQVVLATDGQKSFVFFTYSEFQLYDEYYPPNIGFNAGDGVRSYMFPGALTYGLDNTLRAGTNVGLRGLHTYIYRVDLPDILIPGDIAVLFEQGSYTVGEDAGVVEVCVVSEAESTATVLLSTVDATTNQADRGTDYTPVQTTFTISPGGRQCISITILDDQTAEFRERFHVQLNASRSLTVVHIKDNDALTLTLEQETYTVTEGEGNVQICVATLRGEEGQTANANIFTQDSTATAGNDYTPISLTWVLSAGSRQCTNITILDDSITEFTEEFLVMLTSPDNDVELGTTEAVINILDIDTVVCTPECQNGVCTFPGVCVCEPEWTGAACDIDINECSMRLHNCSQVGPAPAVCVNLRGGFRCSCNLGYSLREVDYASCEDTNECELGTHNCSNEGPAPAQCINDMGSYHCSCDHHTGYELSRDDDISCVDVDECDQSTHNCSLEGVVPARCVNTVGGFMCSCEQNPGYKLSTLDYASCEDIDECATETHNCTRDGIAPARCINEQGGFRCSCNQYLGFVLSESSTACEDVDECEKGISGCSHNCSNTVGSYHCLCRMGYELADDNRTCEDVNECLVNNGGCERPASCINTPGSYYCRCPRGYEIQSDGHNCSALRCPTLSAPQNGSIMECPANPTVGSQCRFACEDGYNLVGSETRICQPSVTWSGQPAFCEPQLCGEPTSSDHGFVLLPCTKEYSTSCTTQCEDGYAINGTNNQQTCILRPLSRNLIWTEPPTCIESNICENRCLHNGTCSSSDGTSFVCDCEGTGYTGPTCDTGIITVSPIPDLTQNMPSENINISANPDQELEILVDGGEVVVVNPRSVKITPPATIAYFNVTARQPGILSLRYEIGGSGATNFLAPPESPAFVMEETPGGHVKFQYFRQIYQGTTIGNIFEGCCSREDLFFQCPMSRPSNRVTFQAGCIWNSDDMTHSTSGLVFVANQDFTMPLSVAGVNVTTNRSLVTASLPEFQSGNCMPCKDNQPCIPDTRCTADSCCCYDFTNSDTNDFLKSQSLAFTSMSHIESLLPPWVQMLSVRSIAVRNNAIYEYISALISAEMISQLEGCEEIEANNEGLYLVFRYGGILEATIDSQRLYSFTEIPSCFSIDMCRHQNSPLFIQLSPVAHSVITSQFLREYTLVRGWDITIKSIILSRIPGPLPNVTALSNYWNGIQFFQPRVQQLRFDIVMKTDSQTLFSSQNLEIDLTFSGTAHYNYQERDGILDGELMMSVTTRIASGSASLILTNPSGLSVVNINEGQQPSEDRCTEREDPSGIAFKMNIRQRREQLFYRKLFFFPEETTECPVDAFMNLNDNLELQSFSFHTTCPHLSLDRLIFTGMAHTLYYSGNSNFAQFCLPGAPLADNTGPTSLLIHSTLQGDRLRIPLGRFFTLVQGPSSIALSVAYSQEDPSFLAMMHSVRVAVLQGNFATSIKISDNMMHFEVSTEIFNNFYPVDLRGTAPTNESSWDRLPLSLSGVMTGGENSFVEGIQLAIESRLLTIANETEMRQKTLNESRQRSQIQLQQLERQLNNSRTELAAANQTHMEQLDRVAVANETFLQAQRVFESASSELRQLQQDMNNICTVEDCEDTCVNTGPVCETSYKDTFTKQTGRCPFTEYETRQRRVEPFYRTATVWIWNTTCRRIPSVTCDGVCTVREVEPCTGRCISISETVPNYNWISIQVAVQRLRNCTVRVYNGTEPQQLCREVFCPRMQPNNQCLRNNSMCQTARQTALDSLESDITEPFDTLGESRQNLSLARSEATGTQVRLEAAQQRVNQIQPAYESSEEAKRISDDKYQMALDEIQPSLRLSERVTRYNQQLEQLLNVTNVTFEITIVTVSPSQLPLEITYETPFNQQVFQRVIDTDLSAPSQLVFDRIAEEIIETTFVNTSGNFKRSVGINMRSKRQEVERNENQLRFEENCADLHNVEVFLNEIAQSLLQLNESLANARQATANRSIPTELDEDVLNAVDLTVLETVFNVTTSTDELMQGVENDEVIMAYAAIDQEVMMQTAELLDAAETEIFADWQVRIEILYNQSSSVGSYQCFSFSDCLFTAGSILERLIRGTPGPLSRDIAEELPSAREELLQLGTTMNLTVAEAVQKVLPILAILESYSEVTYWCSSPPEITLQPPAEVNVSTNGTLSLTCEAESDLPITYQWRKDGNEIPGANSESLVITNLQRLDSGNYSCHVSNAVGTVPSINTSVLVYELPQFYLTLIPTSVYEGDDNGAWFACNATAWPFPGWRWYFRPSEDSQFTAIDEEDTNELLIPNPQKENEGWYTCEAFNGHGSIRDDPVFLRVLPVTVSQQAIPMQFLITSEEPLQPNECEGEILQALEEIISDPTVIVSNLEVFSRTVSTYVVRFSLVSINATEEDIADSTLAEIANKALPTRAALQNSKTSVSNTIQRGEFEVECGSTVFDGVPNSITFRTVTYICPPGQRLSSNYLLCVGCEPGSYSDVTEQSRVFSGEALTERVPVCTPCPTGTYEPRVGSSQCMSCPEFHTTASIGATSADECTVDPLLMECSASGTAAHVVISCRTNRSPSTTLCSFDDSLEHACDLPIAVNLQSFGPGDHSVRIRVADSVGFTAEETVHYFLQSDSRTNFLPDVPPLAIHLTNNSPRIVGSTMQTVFVLTRPASSVTCQIRRNEQQDCSSGSIMFTDLDPGSYTLRIAATNSREDRAFLRRRFEITSDPSLCIIHLINDGVTVENDRATVEFAGTGPAESFTCKLNDSPSFTCTTPVVLSDLQAGDHTLRIIPSGCGRNRRPLRVDFQV